MSVLSVAKGDTAPQARSLVGSLLTSSLTLTFATSGTFLMMRQRPYRSSQLLEQIADLTTVPSTDTARWSICRVQLQRIRQTEDERPVSRTQGCARLEGDPGIDAEGLEGTTIDEGTLNGVMVVEILLDFHGWQSVARTYPSVYSDIWNGHGGRTLLTLPNRGRLLSVSSSSWTSWSWREARRYGNPVSRFFDLER